MAPFFAYHMPSFTYPDAGPDAIFERTAELALAAEAAGFDAGTGMDHLYPIGGVRHAGALGRPQEPGAPGDAGHGRHVPQPRPAGEDGDHAGRDLARPGDP